MLNICELAPASRDVLDRYAVIGRLAGGETHEYENDPANELLASLIPW
jgi:hypothetical protein